MATKRKLSDEQIIAVMKQLEAGRSAAEMAPEVGVSTYTNFETCSSGVQAGLLSRIRHLEVKRQSSYFQFTSRVTAVSHLANAVQRGARVSYDESPVLYGRTARCHSAT